ncbi:COX6B2, partial [Cervus elaphus hippelaphus]
DPRDSAARATPDGATGTAESATRRRPAERRTAPPSSMLGAECPKPCKGKWPTPPFDPRFPNQNQTRNCYQNFLGGVASFKRGGIVP